MVSEIMSVTHVRLILHWNVYIVRITATSKFLDVIFWADVRSSTIDFNVKFWGRRQKNKDRASPKWKPLQFPSCLHGSVCFTHTTVFHSQWKWESDTEKIHEEETTIFSTSCRDFKPRDHLCAESSWTAMSDFICDSVAICAGFTWTGLNILNVSCVEIPWDWDKETWDNLVVL